VVQRGGGVGARWPEHGRGGRAGGRSAVAESAGQGRAGRVRSPERAQAAVGASSAVAGAAARGGRGRGARWPGCVGRAAGELAGVGRARAWTGNRDETQRRTCVAVKS
jgi:hypothetical protein